MLRQPLAPAGVHISRGARLTASHAAMFVTQWWVVY